MNNTNDGERIPSVSRVVGDTIIDLIYDPNANKTALVVSRFGGLWNSEQEVRIETGEILVPYSAKNNLISTGCVRLPSRPEHHGSKDELLSRVQEFLHRYVDLDPLFEKICAYYILLTWVFDRFTDLPYLRLRGAFGTGKTRALLVIGSICYKSFFASGASTTSPIFHTLDAFGGTLVLDEADFRFSDRNSELVKILNNGTTRGLPVLRTMQNRFREFDPRAFRVYGPKLLAMRGQFEDMALESRFFTGQSGKRELRPEIPIHLPASFEKEALELRNQLLYFRLCEFFNIRTIPSAVPSGIRPRARQTALSLLSLVEDAGLREQIAAHLAQEFEASDEQLASALPVRIASCALELFAETGVALLPVGDIANRLNPLLAADGITLSNRSVGTLLRVHLGIITRKSHGVYGIPISEKEKIVSFVARICAPDSSTPNSENAASMP